VFIVGDDKQSIYGFRDADVRLFRRATTDIREANLRTSPDDGFRPLSRSFRMHQDLCASINAMCRRIFVPADASTTLDATSFEVPYVDLVAGIEAPTSDHLGTCARIDVQNDEFNEVARTIVGILRGHHRFDVAVWDRGTGTWSVRAPHPGDFAVLVRKNDDVRNMASALRLCGVPFHVHGGRAFFSRPEVADIRALLRTCVDASDDLAAATVLRSPVLRCTDAEIAACAIAGRRSSLRDGLDVLVREGRASASLIAAHEHFTAWSESILAMPLPTFIRTALDTTRWHEAIAGDDRRDQILANVEKVLDIVRSTIDGTGAGIADVIDALTPPESDREREGAVEVDGDAVQVMTIHASKGLEFNIVILAGLNGGASPSSVVRSEAFGLTASLADKEVRPENLLTPVKLTPSLIHKANTIINDRRSVAETRRMLYVALTRAKMHVLCALPDPDAERLPKRSDVTRRMEEAMDALPASRLRRIRPLADVERYVPVRSEPMMLNLTASVTVPAPDLIAPSALMRLTADHDDGDMSDGGSASGMVFGTAVHDALAAVIRTAQTMSVEELTETIVRTLARHDIDRSAAREAVDEILAVLDLDLVKAEASTLPFARVETRLAGALDDLVLHGIMDVRLQRADGTIDVWDWKTNNVRSSDDVDSLATVYAIQMCVYAWLCLRAYPDAPAVHTRLVFTKAARRGLAVVDQVRTWHRSDMAVMERQIMAMAVPAA
jgi:ATP-dependent helicase/nuclease subunit A